MKGKPAPKHTVYFLYSEENTPTSRNVNSMVFVCGESDEEGCKFLNCAYRQAIN